MSSDNVVDFKGRPSKSGSNQAPVGSAPVINITERRQEIISAERRKVRRTILTSFIGAFCVVPRKGLVKVHLVDISDTGLAFDMETAQGQFPLNEEIVMRVYLTQDSYFSFPVKVQNVRVAEQESTYRHGAAFMQATPDQALHHFIKFIETVSPTLQFDTGDHVSTGSTGRSR